MVYFDLNAKLVTMQVTAWLWGGSTRPPARASCIGSRSDSTRATEPATAIAVPVIPRRPRCFASCRPPQAPADEFLSVETLTDLFTPLPADAPAAAAPPIAVMLHEFVAQFQDLAREWDGASGAQADGRRRPLSAAS